MTQKASSDALSAILEEALKLLGMDLSEEAEARVETIISIARYQADIRTAEEKAAKYPRLCAFPIEKASICSLQIEAFLLIF